MSPWIAALIPVGTAVIITAAIAAWLYLWVHLNVDRGWPFWLCGTIALLPVIAGVYVLVALSIGA